MSKARHTYPSVRLIDRLLIRGAKMPRDVAEAVRSADCSVAVDQVSEITMVLHDPDFKILRKGKVKTHTPVDLERLHQEVWTITTQTGSDGHGELSLAIRSAAIRKLRDRRGTKVMHKSSPTDFVKAECKAIGCKVIAQDSPTRKVVARDTRKSTEQGGSSERPSSWTTFQRLATELGYWCFEAANVIYFGQPTWLIERDDDAAVVTWDEGKWTDCVGVPGFTDSVDNDQGLTVQVQVPSYRLDEFYPGERLKMRFEPYGENRFIVKALSFPVAASGGLLTVTAGKPVNPKPQPPPKPTSTRSGSHRGGTDNTSDGGSHSGNGWDTTTSHGKSALDMVTLALQQVGDQYIFGAEASPSDPNPDAFDCSELVQWAVDRCGGYIPDGSANQQAYIAAHHTQMSVDQALATRGALLFWGSPAHHVAISLGGHRGTVEAADREYGVCVFGTHRSFSWTTAGRVPGLSYNGTPARPNPPTSPTGPHHGGTQI